MLGITHPGLGVRNWDFRDFGFLNSYYNLDWQSLKKPLLFDYLFIFFIDRILSDRAYYWNSSNLLWLTITDVDIDRDFLDRLWQWLWNY